jgi:hypothetical protein
MNGILRELDVPPLRLGQVTQLVIASLAPQYGQTYVDHGMLGFDYPYHYAERLWFRVIVVRAESVDFATLTPITEPTPVVAGDRAGAA